MPTTDELALPTLDLLAPAYQADPHGANAAARSQGWLARLTIGGVAVLDYEHCRAVLRDERFHSALTMSLAMQGITSGPLWDRVANLLLALEGPDHDRLRARLEGFFTVDAVARLRPALHRDLAAAVDRVAPAGRADVVTDLADPYPLTAIAGLLDLPADRLGPVSGWIEQAMEVFGPSVGPQQAAIESAFTSLEAELATLAEVRRGAPGDDLLSALVGGRGGEELSDQAVFGAIESIVLPGVQEPRGQLAAAVQAFCAHPDQWAELAADHRLAGAAADEALRWCPVLIGTFRVAAEAAEIDGVTFPAGTVVVVMTSSANRDPDVFEEPDTFDLHRHPTHPHLAYGAGAHECLGRHLARLELAEALTVLSQRLAGLAAAGPAPWKPLTGVSGPSTLPVTFTPSG